MFSDLRRLAVVGVAKNTGKTTTLNAIATHERARGRALGLFSVGIDGERSDALMATPKPPVHALDGELLVTSSRFADEGSARFEFVRDLGIRTPLGDALVVRCIRDGDVILAGLRHREDFARAADALEEEGAELVLIDGAYGRVVGARLADAIVLATGAVLGRDIESVITATEGMVRAFTLPNVTEEWQRELLQTAVREDQTLMGGPSIEPRALESRSALVALSQARGAWDEAVEAIAIPGLVSDGIVEELLVAGGERTLLIPDPTVLHAGARALEKLRRTWQVNVLRSPQLVGISVNPTSVRGANLDSRELVCAMRERWPSIEIFDPLEDLREKSESAGG